MALELLFTSAVQGLKSGSQGYCTVQCTQAMPGPLAERLEALSAYRPIYPSQSEQAKFNPVNVAYWRIRAVGKTFPVLSRIADYGLDYSQRTNKLAHHLVLEPSELSVAGPAAIAASGAAFVTQWNQKVESIQQPRRLPVAASSMGVCRHWQTVMGDAGWAGVVAEEIIKDQKQPIFLIFEPVQEVLPLIVEVQSLLPAALRWKSTFSTYLTYLPPEAECQIRCLLKGSKEAHESLRHVNSLRVDLTQPTPTQASLLVDAARTGVMPVPVKKPEAATAFDYESDEEPPALPGHQSFAAEPLQLQVDESGRRPGPRGRRKQYNAAPMLPQKRGMGLYIAGGVSVLVLSLVGGVVTMQFLKPGKEKPKELVENVVQTPVAVVSDPMASVVSAPEASNLVEAAPVVQDSPKSDGAKKETDGAKLATSGGGQMMAGDVQPPANSSDEKGSTSAGEGDKSPPAQITPQVLYLADFDAVWKPPESARPALPLIAEHDMIREVRLETPRLIYPEELLPENIGFDVTQITGGFLVKSIPKNNIEGQLTSTPLFEITAASGLPYFTWKRGFNTSYNAPAVLAFSVIELNAERKTYLSLHTRRQVVLSATSGISPHPTAHWIGKRVNEHVIPKGSTWLPLANGKFDAKDVTITFKGVNQLVAPMSLENVVPKIDNLELSFRSEDQILLEPVAIAEYRSNTPEKANEQINAFTSKPLGPIKFTVKVWLDKAELDFNYDRVHEEIRKAQSVLDSVSKSNEQDSQAFREAKIAAKTTIEEYIKKLENLEDVPVSITGRIEYSLEDSERDIMIPVVLVEFVKEPQ